MNPLMMEAMRVSHYVSKGEPKGGTDVSLFGLSQALKKLSHARCGRPSPEMMGVNSDWYVPLRLDLRYFSNPSSG